MDGSILADVRSACNLESTDSGFDKELIPLINTQIMMAHQFGVGRSGFHITSIAETWGEWLGMLGYELEGIKTWLGYSVRLMFDPPDNSTVLKSCQDQIQKIEWMLKAKSEEKGFVSRYAPEKEAFYKELAKGPSATSRVRVNEEYEEED